MDEEGFDNLDRFDDGFTEESFCDDNTLDEEFETEYLDGDQNYYECDEDFSFTDEEDNYDKAP